VNKNDTSRLILQHTKSTLEEYEEDRLNNFKKYDDDDLEGISLVIVEKLEENYVKLMNNNFSGVTKVAHKTPC
jgi:hypothetical protein